MKTTWSAALMAAALALALHGAVVHASQQDDQIVSSARKSHVFRTYLKNDDVKVESREGVVTLTGTVADDPTGPWPGILLRRWAA